MERSHSGWGRRPARNLPKAACPLRKRRCLDSCRIVWRANPRVRLVEPAPASLASSRILHATIRFAERLERCRMLLVMRHRWILILLTLVIGASSARADEFVNPKAN